MVFARSAMKLDDLLGEVVARGRLGAEEVGVGDKVGVGVLPQLLVGGQDVQGVQVLALVLVQALDLYVKQWSLGSTMYALGLFQVLRPGAPCCRCLISCELFQHRRRRPYTAAGSASSSAS